MQISVQRWPLHGRIDANTVYHPLFACTVLSCVIPDREYGLRFTFWFVTRLHFLSLSLITPSLWRLGGRNIFTADNVNVIYEPVLPYFSGSLSLEALAILLLTGFASLSLCERNTKCSHLSRCSMLMRYICTAFALALNAHLCILA